MNILRLISFLLHSEDRLGSEGSDDLVMPFLCVFKVPGDSDIIHLALGTNV